MSTSRRSRTETGRRNTSRVWPWGSLSTRSGTCGSDDGVPWDSGTDPVPGGGVGAVHPPGREGQVLTVMRMTQEGLSGIQ